MTFEKLRQIAAEVIAGGLDNYAYSDYLRFSGRWRMEQRDKDGLLLFAGETPNLVVNAGLDDILDKYFKGSTYTAAHYVGLKGAGSAAAGDTMSSHAGWSEVTAYSEGARQTFTAGTVSSQSVDNSAATADFSMNGSYTVAGCFLTTNSTKSGSTGTLYSAGDFAASRSGGSGDTLSITYTATTAAA